jgi:hypothetical protein
MPAPVLPSQCNRHPGMTSVAISPGFRGLLAAAFFMLAAVWSAPARADAGNVLCNDGTTPIYFATIIEDIDAISLRCELGRKDCHVQVSGWYLLGPGKCGNLASGSHWTTYLSVYSKRADGKTRASSFKVNPSFYDNNEEASSGVKDLSICADPVKEFERRYEGTINEVLGKPQSCANGDERIPINLVMRSQGNVELTLHIQ